MTITFGFLVLLVILGVIAFCRVHWLTKRVENLEVLVQYLAHKQEKGY
jgi:hypothetical protein